MTSNGRVVGSTDELVSGDAIEAFHEGTLIHRGPVMDTIPGCGLLWILDTLTGDRRLLDASGLEIVRIPPPAVEPWPGDFLRSDRRQDGTGTTSYWRDVSPLG
jgi:hypothetical protein